MAGQVFAGDGGAFEVTDRWPQRKKVLARQETRLKDCRRQHHDNAGVIHQELAAKNGIIVSLRIFERAV
ncbi:hypothetical protein [Bradyrhizobium canariense]|uniref:hypothetical protein n=1 Tax=Bradyrhizobium TaxID=374 RepID=UPI001178BC70|nr:hypothetical protein [Bradyrhizobium canariense]